VECVCVWISFRMTARAKYTDPRLSNGPGAVNGSRGDWSSWGGEGHVRGGGDFSPCRPPRGLLPFPSILVSPSCPSPRGRYGPEKQVRDRPRGRGRPVERLAATHRGVSRGSTPYTHTHTHTAVVRRRGDARREALEAGLAACGARQPAAEARGDGDFWAVKGLAGWGCPCGSPMWAAQKRGGNPTLFLFFPASAHPHTHTHIPRRPTHILYPTARRGRAYKLSLSGTFIES
jgi:hypothetical protein